MYIPWPGGWLEQTSLQGLGNVVRCNVEGIERD